MFDKNKQVFQFDGKDLTIYFNTNAIPVTCAFKTLVNLGMPFQCSLGVSQQEYRPATANWILNNWPTNTPLMMYLIGITDKLKEKGSITISVATKANLKDAKALGYAIETSIYALKQLRDMLIKPEDQVNTVDEPGFHALEHEEGLTLAGTKPPDFTNNNLHKLSFQERQELLAKAMQRLEEVPRSEKQ